MWLPSLRRLARRPLRNRDFQNLLESPDLLTDRERAIVYASMVERELEIGILFRLARPTRVHKNALFERGKALSTLYNKIHMAHALNMFGPTIVADLETINSIRNQFAHSFQKLEFKHKAITAHCKNLKTPSRAVAHGIRYSKKRQRPREAKDLYSWTCWLLWAGLGTGFIKEHRPHRARDSFAREIMYS